MKPLLLAATVLLAAAGLATAGAKKQSDVAIRFHAQGGSEGGNFSQKVTLLNSGRELYMQSMPLISEQEIKAFYPFPARDGTMGAYFKLDAHGNNLFSQHTMSRRGSYVFAFINGRHVIDLYVDRTVNDGIISIPSGLTRTDIDRLELALPVIGQENVKPGAKKKEKARAKPAPDSAALPAVIPADALTLQPAMRRQADGTIVPATTSGGATAADMAQPSYSMVGKRQ